MNMSFNSSGKKIYRQGKNSPEYIAGIIINDLLMRHEFMYYHVDNVHSIHYAEACTGFGAFRLAGLLKDADLISKLKERYSKVIDDKIINTANHVDANVYGILPLEIFIQTGDEKFLKQGIELADIQWQNPLPGGMSIQTRYWIDDIYMISCLQVQAYNATKNETYLEKAALEIDSYIKKLQRPNGLFYHGNSAKYFWGRGNGWVASGLAELLIRLPETNKYYQSIKNGYIKMMHALKDYQCEDGMWRQLIDNKNAWKESSGSAMFGYSIAAGVKKGILSKNEFLMTYEKAWNALIEYMTDDGKLKNICTGTGQSNDVEYYMNRPIVTGDLHGQSSMLWFAYALLNDYKK